MSLSREKSPGLIRALHHGGARSVMEDRAQAEKEANSGFHPSRALASQEKDPGSRAGKKPLLTHDLAQTKIHTDAAAARLAQEEHARAVTVDEEIYFGSGEFRPNTAPGQALLQHELTHVAQQREGRAPEPVQHEPKKVPKAGLGSQPPDEFYIRAEGPALEQDHVLFDYDQAGLEPVEKKKLQALLEKEKAAVVVELHGYASHEGLDEYNYNMSAHRAAAVKKAILQFLPPGSEVDLYGHGETGGFDTPKANRRVGITVRPKPMELTQPTLLGGGKFWKPHQKTPFETEFDRKMQELDRNFGPPTEPSTQPKVDVTKIRNFPLPPYPNINTKIPADPTSAPEPDSLSLVGDFYLRGLAPTPRDMFVLRSLYEQNYRFFQPFKRFSSPVLTIDDKKIRDWASSAAGAAAGLSLGRDQPTTLERLNEQDFKLGVPKPTVLPLRSWEFDLSSKEVKKSQEAAERRRKDAESQK